MIEELDAIRAMTEMMLERAERMRKLDPCGLKEDKYYGYSEAMRSVLECIDHLKRQKQKENL